MLEELRQIAFRFQIDPKHSIGHAARLESVITVLKGIQESYNNYLKIEFLNNEKFAEAYENNNKLLDTVREDLELLVVDLNYGSFEAAVAPNLTTTPTLFNNTVLEWEQSIYTKYRDHILTADFEDPKYFNSIFKNYTEVERNKIYKPLFSIVSEDRPYRINIIDRQGKQKKILKHPVKGLYELYVPKIARVEEEQPTKIVHLYARMKPAEKGDYRFNKQTLKDVVFYEELTHEVYPYKPDVINFEDTTYVLNHRLECSVSFEDDSYIIHNELLDITVWGDTREGAEDAFAFSFHALYLNYVEEEDVMLSEDAKRLKETLSLLVKIKK